MPAASDPSSADRSLRLSAAAIRALDLSPLQSWAARPAAELLGAAGSLELHYDWPRADDDPRELSEIAEPRLWTLRADACYPWLPLLIERGSGQLTRHVAMLLPHGFSRSEGIRFAPEALELWLTHRLYLLDHWAVGRGLNCRQGLSQMAAVLGLELDDSFWTPLDSRRG
ncbi:MAG: CRR6 family NdhI maturation factor [Cyanobacteria bacterium J06638_7]